jgi:hypothetical protein
MSTNWMEKGKFVSALVEASSLLRQLAAPHPAGDKVKAAIGRAGRRLSIWLSQNGHEQWSENRIKDVWKSDRRIVISADELEQLRGCHAAKYGIDRDPSIRELREHVARLAARLESLDPEFDASSLESVRAAALDHRRSSDIAG